MSHEGSGRRSQTAPPPGIGGEARQIGRLGAVQVQMHRLRPLLATPEQRGAEGRGVPAAIDHSAAVGAERRPEGYARTRREGNSGARARRPWPPPRGRCKFDAVRKPVGPGPRLRASWLCRQRMKMAGFGSTPDVRCCRWPGGVVGDARAWSTSPRGAPPSGPRRRAGRAAPPLRPSGRPFRSSRARGGAGRGTGPGARRGGRAPGRRP